MECAAYALGRMSVSVGVGSDRHARVQRRIAQQRLARCAHAFVRRADQGGAAQMCIRDRYERYLEVLEPEEGESR